MSGQDLEALAAAFVELQQARFPEAQWDSNECWLAQDWEDFAPSIPWLVARYYIHEMWNSRCPQAA